MISWLITYQKDILQTIHACASSYDVSTISRYSITLWDSLKYEIFNAQEEDLAEEALAALHAVATRLSLARTSAEAKTCLAHYLKAITRECNEHLKAPQHKQAKPAGQILRSLGTASPFAFQAIVKAVLPTMLTLYQDADDVSRKKELLEVVLQLLHSAIPNYGISISTTSSQLENPLEPFKDTLFEILSQAMMSATKEGVPFRVVALKCLVLLCSFRHYLHDNEIGMAVQYFNEIVLSEDRGGRIDLEDEAIQALVEISRIKPALIMDITFPAFMSRLPDKSILDNTDYVIILEGLARLSVERIISDTLVRRLLNKLDVILQNGGTADYPQAILSTLYFVLSRRNLASDTNIDDYYQKIVVGLVRRTALAAAGFEMITALNELTSLEMLGRLSNLIVRALDFQKQQTTATHIYTLFTEKDHFTQVLFNEGIAFPVRSTIILSTYLMAALPREVNLALNFPR